MAPSELFRLYNVKWKRDYKLWIRLNYEMKIRFLSTLKQILFSCWRVGCSGHLEYRVNICRLETLFPFHTSDMPTEIPTQKNVEQPMLLQCCPLTWFSGEQNQSVPLRIANRRKFLDNRSKLSLKTGCSAKTPLYENVLCLCLCLDLTKYTYLSSEVDQVLLTSPGLLDGKILGN
jgi:hypothetical protein